MTFLKPRVIGHCFTLLLYVATSYATDLMDVYRQALEYDPVFKGAYSTFMSQAEMISIAQAPLLPQLALAALAGQNTQDVKTNIGQFAQTYTGNQWKVSASQAIFNYQAWSQVQQAKAAVKGALASFNDAAQNLVMRTAQSYFEVLYTIDVLNFAEAKQRANRRQLEQAKERFNVGLDPITSVYEAQAAYDQSIAQVITARNGVVNKNESLSKITNHVYDKLAPLRDSHIPLIRPEPNNVDDWVSTGLKQNYSLYAAKYALQAARENIKTKNAGNWPVFSVQGTSSTTHYNFRDNAPMLSSGNILSNLFVPSKQVVSNVNVSMNFPAYQGGLVQAQARQAQYDFQTSSEQLEKIYRDIVANSRTAFNAISDGISKVKADRQTVSSQQNALSSVAAQYEVGTRTMTDVVTAQQHLFEAQQQLADDQYKLILSLLYLKYLSGTLNVSDLEEINSWLSTIRVDSLPPGYKHPLESVPSHG